MITRLIARALEVPLAVHDVAVEPLDAIIILGAPLRRDGSMSRVLAERVGAAIDLYRAGGAPLIVATGGVTYGAVRAEADVIAEALEAAGVERSRIVVENRSGTTDENVRFAAQLLDGSVRRVWVVTQPFHGKRAARLWRRAGFEPRVWHIADSIQYSDRRRALRWLMREYASWGVMLLRDLR